MGIQITGKFSSDGTLLFTGNGSKLSLELRAGDIITDSMIVEAVINDNLFIVKSNTLGICSDIDMFIEQANVNYLLPSFDINYSSISSFKGINQDLLTTKTFVAGGIKVSNLLDLCQLDFDLNSSKVLEFNKDFDYYVPTISKTVLCSATGSTSLISTLTTIQVYCTVNNTQITIQSVIKDISLSVGMYIGIDGHQYRITSIDFTSLNSINYIKVDKPLHKSGIFYIASAIDMTTFYTAGDTILVNGSMANVINVTVNSIQIDYPMPSSSNIIVKKPLVGVTIANSNSLKLSNNYDFDGSYLATGCKIFIQYVSSQDSINGTSLCYTEANQIVRNNNPIVITSTKFKRGFKGIVILAKPSNGLYKIDSTRVLTATSTDYNQDLSVNALAAIDPKYLLVDDIAYHIQEIYYNTIRLDIVAPLWKTFYLAIGVSSYSYTPKIQSLANLLAYSIILSGQKQASSVPTLLQKYYKTFTYSLFKDAYEYRIISKYNPLYFATIKTAAAPISIKLQFANIKYTSNTIYKSSIYSCLYRLGLRLLGDK